MLGIVLNDVMRTLNAGSVGFQRPLRRWQVMLRTRPDAVKTVGGFRRWQLQLLAYRCFLVVQEILRCYPYRQGGSIQECCYQIPVEATCSLSVPKNRLGP